MTGFAALLASAIMILAGSCIKNDLPYPWIMPSVNSFTVAPEDAQGNPLLSSATVIDSVNHTVTLNLTEWADIENVPVDGWELSQGTVLVSPSTFPSSLNLTSPFKFSIELYDRTFEWEITAIQNIERYFTVSSQIGSSIIDADNHTVKAYVPEGQNLTTIHVRTIKLGGLSAEMAPDLAGKTVDFTNPVKVNVTEFGRTTEWTITIETTDVSVSLDRVDAWTCVAWAYASAEHGKQNGFEYRLATADDWTAVPAEWITEGNGSLSCCLRHLQPQTQYVIRATSGDDHSAEVDFTTGSEVQLPNSHFTNWWLNGKVWNPWAENGEQYWDTGNRGATTLGDSNTTPIEDPNSSTGYRGAQLLSKFVGISIIGKLAAGNLFAGQFVKVDGTNGILDFGQPFTQRPTALKVRLKYQNVNITHASKSNPNFQDMMGQPDTCIVWASLGDWNEPYEIRTKPSDRKLFNRNEPEVIAYGEFTSGNPISDYTTITIPLEYTATNRVPKYLLLTASASKYGDYFTGGNGSVLCILGYELVYDLE